MSTILSNSSLNVALENHRNIVDLQWVLPAAKILSQTTSWYTLATFSLLLGISILFIATVWWKKSLRQLYYVIEAWTVLRTILYKLLNTICMPYYTKYHYGRIVDIYLNQSISLNLVDYAVGNLKCLFKIKKKVT